MIERIERIINISVADADTGREIAAIHRELFGEVIHVCISCPSSLRAAFNRIKVYYDGEKGRVK